MSRLIDATESQLPDEPLVGKLWDLALRRSGNTWEQRRDLWKRLHQVRLRDFDHDEPLQGFIEARNAISHGLGDLTRMQLRKNEEVRKLLTAAGLRLRGATLLLHEEDVEQCATIVRAFIEWLDERV